MSTFYTLLSTGTAAASPLTVEEAAAIKGPKYADVTSISWVDSSPESTTLSALLSGPQVPGVPLFDLYQGGKAKPGQGGSEFYQLEGAPGIPEEELVGGLVLEYEAASAILLAPDDFYGRPHVWMFTGGGYLTLVFYSNFGPLGVDSFRVYATGTPPASEFWTEFKGAIEAL